MKVSKKAEHSGLKLLFDTSLKFKDVDNGALRRFANDVNRYCRIRYVDVEAATCGIFDRQTLLFSIQIFADMVQSTPNEVPRIPLSPSPQHHVLVAIKLCLESLDTIRGHFIEESRYSIYVANCQTTEAKEQPAPKLNTHP
jgi:predicted glutamine amidotransferase